MTVSRPRDCSSQSSWARDSMIGSGERSAGRERSCSSWAMSCEILWVSRVVARERSCAMRARCSLTSGTTRLAASVGVAIPADQEQHGYLSEHHSFGETEEKAGEYAEDLAASMLATTLGIEFDPDTAWDERENLFKMSGKIVRTSNITQSAIGNKDGLWTTVFAACAFVNDDN